MPQMSPMNWFYLMWFNMICYFYFMMYLYFILICKEIYKNEFYYNLNDVLIYKFVW